MKLMNKQLVIALLLATLVIALPTQATTSSSFIEIDRPFTFEKGSGLYPLTAVWTPNPNAISRLNA